MQTFFDIIFIFMILSNCFISIYVLISLQNIKKALTHDTLHKVEDAMEFIKSDVHQALVSLRVSISEIRENQNHLKSPPSNNMENIKAAFMRRSRVTHE
jgi:hypothetical protein